MTHPPGPEPGRAHEPGRAREPRPARESGGGSAAQPHRRASGSSHRADPVWAGVVEVLAEREAARPGAALEVVDVGGGSGAYAVQLARRGHRVTVIDPSPNALATLERRAKDADVADRIRAIQGDAGGLTELVPAGEADLVLCHGVLDVVDDPVEAAGQVAALAADDAPVSVVVAGRHGAVVGRVLTGHLPEALAILRSPDGTYGGSDPLPRRFTADSIADLLAGAGLTVRLVRGVRAFGDLIGSGGPGGGGPGGDTGSGEVVSSPDVAMIDELVADDPVFRSVAATLHVVADRRPGDG